MALDNNQEQKAQSCCLYLLTAWWSIIQSWVIRQLTVKYYLVVRREKASPIPFHSYTKPLKILNPGTSEQLGTKLPPVTCQGGKTQGVKSKWKAMDSTHTCSKHVLHPLGKTGVADKL